jgi:hypothetical protein
MEHPPAVVEDDEMVVRALVRNVGVPATETEIAIIVNGYGHLRGMIELLYAVPEARFVSPGLHFDPTQTLTEWQ